MKVGDLIKDKHAPEIGIIVAIQQNHHCSLGLWSPYCVWCEGKIEWYEAEYIETECEVISESR